MVLAAAVEKPEEVADEILQQYQKELSKLVVEAKRSWHQLKMQTETRSATAASSKGSKGSSSTEVGRKPASKDWLYVKLRSSLWRMVLSPLHWQTNA